MGDDVDIGRSVVAATVVGLHIIDEGRRLRVAELAVQYRYRRLHQGIEPDRWAQHLIAPVVVRHIRRAEVAHAHRLSHRAEGRLRAVVVRLTDDRVRQR